MTREVDVFVGQQGAGTTWQVDIFDQAQDQGGGDDYDIETDTNNFLWDVFIPPESLSLADTTQVDEKNLFGVAFTNPVSLSDPAPTVNKSSGGTARQVVYGTSMYDKDYSSSAAKFQFHDTLLGGNVVAYRVYSGAAVKKWNTDPDLAQVLARPHLKAIFQSFKGSATNAVTGQKDWAPSDLDTYWSQASFPTDKTIYLEWFHEPEDNWSTTAAKAEYRTRLAAFGDYVHANAPSNVFTTGPTYQSFTFTGSGRNPSDWWPGSGHLDFASVDGYNRPMSNAASGEFGYQTYQEKWVDSGWESFVNSVLPGTRKQRWLVGETASALNTDPGALPYANPQHPDTDGTLRAQWAQSMIDNFNARSDQVEAVFWWSSPSNATGTTTNFRLQADAKTPVVWGNAMKATQAFYGW